MTAIVSPKARPSAKTAAPNIPEIPAGNNTPNIVSQRVAPKDMEPLRNSLGTANNTSRLIAAIVGKIIIPRMTPAASIPYPEGAVLNKGNHWKY